MTIPKIASYPMPGAASMPANRVDWRIDPSRAVLLIHDMQDYFLDFYDCAAEPVPTLLASTRRLRDAADAAGVPVVYTAQPAQQSLEDRGLLQQWWGPGLTARPERAGIAAALAPRPSDTVLTKWRYSAFVRSDLRERMRTQGRDQLIICGVYAHIGCMVTAADAFMSDIQPFLVGDALGDFSLEEHAMALSWAARRCGVVIDAAGAVAAMAPQSRLPDSLAALRAEVASLLEMPASDLRSDENLLDAGLDSIRLMSLLSRWRGAGLELTFVTLAAEPTLERWWQLLQRKVA